MHLMGTPKELRTIVRRVRTNEILLLRPAMQVFSTLFVHSSYPRSHCWTVNILGRLVLLELLRARELISRVKTCTAIKLKLGKANVVRFLTKTASPVLACIS